MATGYEEGWGIFGIPYGVLAIACPPYRLYDPAGLTSNDNETMRFPWDKAPLFVVLIALTASGLHER